MQRFIRCDDFAQVLALWQSCFGDDESYVRFFWEECFPMCRGLGYEEDGKLISMLFMLPGALDSSLGAEYIYAVATLPEFRGKGHAAKLTKWAATIAQDESKSALVLCPATQRLYDYYSKLGFVTAFVRQDMGQGHFLWPAHMLEYLQKESALIGRTTIQSNAPGGMLLPLDARAQAWLAVTNGKAFLEYNLE